MAEDDPIGRVREARHRISREHGHDLDKLLVHYQELQERHVERLVPTPEHQGATAQQAVSADGSVRRD